MKARLLKQLQAARGPGRFPPEDKAMGECKLVVENSERVAADQAVRVAGSPIGVLDDRVEHEGGQRQRPVVSDL